MSIQEFFVLQYEITQFYAAKELHVFNYYLYKGAKGKVVDIVYKI